MYLEYCDMYMVWFFIVIVYIVLEIYVCFFFKLRNLVRVLRGNEINLGNRKIVYRIIIMYVYNICMYVYLVCSCNLSR